MLFVHFILCSFLFIFQTSLSNNSASQSDDQAKHGGFGIAPKSEMSKEQRDAIEKELLKQQSEQTKTTEPTKTFSEIEIKEMELVFESSPIEAQLIVSHLRYPTYFPDDKDYRSAIFFGAPGSGKTVTANAIAYKMSKEGWNCKIISSTSLLGEHRNQTAIRLEKELKSAIASKKPTLIIIDELHRLLENADSKNHDTDSTSTALWTFLDKQEGNENFFLIGTMNRIDKLPQPFKNRIISDYIHFPLTTDPKIKNKLIRMYLTTENSILDEEVTDDFLNKELEKLNDCAGRCLKKISRAIGRKNRINESKKSSVTVIKKTTITQVANEHAKRKAEIKYNWVDESDDERQNRHHKENMKMHESHFVQQQLVQIILSYEHNPLISLRDMLHGRENLIALLTDEQKELYANIMAKTQERKYREAAEKAKRDAENSWSIFGKKSS